MGRGAPQRHQAPLFRLVLQLSRGLKQFSGTDTIAFIDVWRIFHSNLVQITRIDFAMAGGQWGARAVGRGAPQRHQAPYLFVAL